MYARRELWLLVLLSGAGCAWNYPTPVYPPFPPDHGYSVPYDPNQQYAAPPNDAVLLQQPPVGGAPAGS